MMLFQKKKKSKAKKNKSEKGKEKEKVGDEGDEKVSPIIKLYISKEQLIAIN